MAANDEMVRNEHFGRQVREGMKRAGLKVQDVMDECEVSRETVRLWRRGEHVARDDRLKVLAKMIGVEPAQMRFEAGKAPTLPAMAGEHVTDEDELALLRAYRSLRKEWARQALRMRAVELLEQFGEPGVANPLGKGRGNGTN